MTPVWSLLRLAAINQSILGMVSRLGALTPAVPASDLPPGDSRTLRKATS